MNQVQDLFHAALALKRISDGVISLNLEGMVTYMNESATYMFSCSGKDLTGKCISQIVSKEIYDKIDQAIYNKNQAFFELLWPELNFKCVEVNVYPSSDGATLLLREITSQQRTIKISDKQEKLLLLCSTANHLIYQKEPKKLLDSLFNDLSDYLDLDVYFHYIIDEEANKLRMLNFTGIPESVAREIEWLEYGEAVCGRVARDLQEIVEEHIDSSDKEYVQLVRGFGIKAYASYPLIAYGKIIGTLSFGSRKRSSFTAEELDLIRTICNPVAMTLDRIFIISKLTQKKEEAEKANKAKSKFISMMSHELRTPLNSIIGFGEILIDHFIDPLSQGQKEKVLKILKASRHLLGVTNDILEITKLDYNKEDLKVEPMKVSTLINNSLKIIQPLADQKGIKINNLTTLYSEWILEVNSIRLIQVLLNLLGNAIKYTQKDGLVTLSCQLMNNRMKIIVSDNGIGIAPEEQKKVFSPFYRIFNKDINIDGVGLGLTIVKQLVQTMGGEVGVDSALGEGSHFWFTVPLYN